MKSQWSDAYILPYQPYTYVREFERACGFEVDVCS